MDADIKGALKQIDKSYKAFEHNGLSMTKQQVKAVLEYALWRGYEHTGQLSASEIDSIIGYPKGTTKEQWDRYYEEMSDFEKKMRAIEPPKDEVPALWNEWLRTYSMDAPNKPGYFRANND